MEYEPVPGKSFLGRGTYGDVELMRLKSDANQLVACKRIKYPKDGTHNSIPEDVRREYEILSMLRHPNIVKYLDFQLVPDLQEARLYMEYCESGSLDDYIRDQAKYQVKTSEEFIWKVLLQLASALMYCHHGVRTSGDVAERDRQVLHRDIKPGNVFLTGNLEAAFTVKLGDFGVGAILTKDGPSPDTYVGIGTKIYTAPEINRVADRITWTEKCDIFSLGCTLHALCNYKAPFEYRMETPDEPLVITQYSDDHSESLKSFVMNCMSFSPESRPDAIKIHERAQEQLRIVDRKPLLGHTKGRLLPGAPIAATTWPGWHYRVYFQDSSGGVREAKHDEGKWTGGDRASVIFKTKLFSPLAAVNDRDGRDIRVFYLSEDSFVRERRYSSTTGWRDGSLNKLRIRAADNSRLAAVWTSTGIRLYFQEPDTNAIQEYYWQPESGLRKLFSWIRHAGWRRGETLQANALSGTSIAAAAWGGDCIRVYYQDTGEELREHCCDGTGAKWYVGHLAVGTIPRNAPISAQAWYGAGIQIRVYWINKKDLMELKWSGGWNPVQAVASLGSTLFSAVQWNDGEHIRAYYQDTTHAVVEKCYSGGKWYNGSRVDDPKN